MPLDTPLMAYDAAAMPPQISPLSPSLLDAYAMLFDVAAMLSHAHALPLMLPF